MSRALEVEDCVHSAYRFIRDPYVSAAEVISRLEYDAKRHLDAAVDGALVGYKKRKGQPGKAEKRAALLKQAVELLMDGKMEEASELLKTRTLHMLTQTIRAATDIRYGLYVAIDELKQRVEDMQDEIDELKR